MQKKHNNTEYQYLINHKNVRKYVDYYSKNRNPAEWEDNKSYRHHYGERYEFQRNLKDAFYTGSDQEIADAYWASVFQLTHINLETNMYKGPNSIQFARAFEDATNEIMSTFKRLRPVDLALNERGGKIQSKYNEFMEYVRTSNPDVYLQIKETEQFYGERFKLTLEAINKYSQNDKFIKEFKHLLDSDRMHYQRRY